jgi:hypothetical protein
MDDHTGHDLTALAPEVDMPAARAAFARRRVQARRRRRIGSAALASLVVLAGAGIWSALPEDDGVVVDSGVATAPDGPAPTTPTPDDSALGPDSPTSAPGSTDTPGDDPAAVDTTPDGSPIVEPGGGCVRSTGSSPATFDPAGGIYAVYLVGVDPEAGTVRFDVIQWLSGDDAVEAYRHDEPGSTDGPPNDYYIVDESHAVRSVPVDPDAAVGLVRLATTGDASVKPATLSELPGYVPAGDPSTTVYWLTVADGMITGICEQYRP